MFVEEKTQGEPQTAEQANRKLKLSEAIRIGARLTEQMKGDQFMREVNGSCRTCAIGAALVGFAGSVEEALRLRFKSYGADLAVKKFGLSDEEVMRISNAYERSERSREEVADWLEAQGL